MNLHYACEKKSQTSTIVVKNLYLNLTLQEKFGFEASSIVQGVKIIYMPFMPGHNKKLPMQ